MRNLDKLKIISFRGATQPLELSFDTKKPVIFIFGENGTGKSTIIDALDCVLNGQPGSLDDRFSVSKKNHLPTVNTSARDLRIEAESDKGKVCWSAVLKGNEISISGSSDRPRAHILRRSRLLKFIDSEPRDRYKSLSQFVEVPGCQKSEDALRDALRDAEREYKSAVTSCELSQKSVSELWEAEGKPYSDLEKWAEAILTQDQTALERELTVLEALTESFKEFSDAQTAIEDAKGRLTKDQQSLNDAIQAVGKEDVSGTQGTLIDLLGKAKEYLNAETDAGKCPVCLQTIDSAKIVEQIEERLGDLSTLISKKEMVSQNLSSVKSSEAIFATAQTTFISKARQLLELHAQKGYGKFFSGVDLSAYSMSDMDVTKEDAFCNKAFALHISLESKMSEVRNALKQNRSQYHKTANIKTLVGNMQEQRRRRDHIQKLYTTLKQVLDVVDSCRKGYVNSVLVNVADSVEEKYVKIHPDENLGAFKLYLDRNYKNSLHLLATFGPVSEEPPQAYYSDSHLDTLGLCIFLALAERFEPEKSVLVLDDIFNSIDQAHLLRTIPFIHDEAKKFGQCVVSTHYRLILEMYRNNRFPVGEIQRILLRPWSLETGIRYSSFALPADDLRKLLEEDSSDRQSIASKGGVLLESLLDFLTERYECRLPRKQNNDFTLHDLLNGINKDLKKLLRSRFVNNEASSAATDWSNLEPIIDELKPMRIIRNMVGGHFNPTGFDFSDKEIEGFGQAVLGLHTLLVCPLCLETPSKPRGTHWSCSCKQFLLEPQIAP